MEKMFEQIKKIMTEPRVSIGMFVLFIALAIIVTRGALISGGKARESILRTPYHIGEEAVINDLSIEVHSVRRDSVGGGPLTPRSGYEFVIPTVTIKNNGSKPFEFIPLFNFHIKDGAGNVYNVAAVVSEGNQLSGPVPPHDAVREEIGFEVAKGATDLALYFDSGGLDRTIIVIDLNKK